MYEKLWISLSHMALQSFSTPLQSVMWNSVYEKTGLFNSYEFIKDTPGGWKRIEKCFRMPDNTAFENTIGG